mmetsp:Transcript_13747/g.47943  ORF Transcript_13747/g.47943 Transcript_13747/m.47943 type:complete len:242 (-) Transcript_13747:189-914(-)
MCATSGRASSAALSVDSTSTNASASRWLPTEIAWRTKSSTYRTAACTGPMLPSSRRASLTARRTIAVYQTPCFAAAARALRRCVSATMRSAGSCRSAPPDASTRASSAANLRARVCGRSMSSSASASVRWRRMSPRASWYSFIRASTASAGSRRLRTRSSALSSLSTAMSALTRRRASGLRRPTAPDVLIADASFVCLVPPAVTCTAPLSASSIASDAAMYISTVGSVASGVRGRRSTYGL